MDMEPQPGRKVPLSSGLVVRSFPESEKGTAAFIDGVHGPRKDPWLEEGSRLACTRS